MTTARDYGRGSTNAIDVVGEFVTLREARAADVDADALVLAPDGSHDVYDVNETMTSTTS